MTRASGPRVSIALLLVALVVAWRITKPRNRPHHPRPKPAVHGVTESLGQGTRPIERGVAREEKPDALRGANRVAATHEVRFRVTTPEGAPIADASAQSKVDTGVFRADAGGKGAVESEKPIPVIRVAAPGYELLEAPVLREEELLEVKLRPAATLTIRLTTPSGAPVPTSVTVKVEAPRPLCVAQAGNFLMPSDLLWSAAGNSEALGSVDPFQFRTISFVDRRTGETRALDAPPPPRIWSMLFRDTPVRICPVQPGLPITISVWANLGGESVTKNVELAPGEWRVVDIRLPGDFGQVSGRVVSREGAPIPDAKVTMIVLGAKREQEPMIRVPFARNFVASAPSRVLSQTTDAHGAFDLGAVPARVFELVVESSDHAPWISKDHRVAPDAKPLTITMDSGVSVGASFIDGDGKPLPGAGVSVAGRTATTDAEGRVRFQHLPRGVVSFDTFFGGVRTSFPHDTSNPDPTFQIQVINR